MELWQNIPFFSILLSLASASSFTLREEEAVGAAVGAGASSRTPLPQAAHKTSNAARQITHKKRFNGKLTSFYAAGIQPCPPKSGLPCRDSRTG